MYYYFAYGMNTNKYEMALRCPNAKSLGPAVLFDHVFEFRNHADVRHTVGSTVHGALWEITDECLEALDILEGYPHYYTRKEDLVAHEELGAIEAIFYHMNDQEGLSAPSEIYYDMVEEGYKEHNINTRVLLNSCDDAVIWEISKSL